MFEEQVPRWLRRVELEVGTERQTAIIEAAQATRSEVVPTQCMSLVMLAHSVDERDAYDLIRESLVERDSTFGCAIDDLETRIIAGVFAAAILDEESEIATLTGEAILSAQWSGMTPAIDDLPTAASDALFRRSEAHRSRTRFAITTDFSGALRAIPEYPDDGGGVTHNEIIPLSVALTKTAETVKRAIEQAATRINNRFVAADEELDVLWWAFSDYSEIEGCRWAETAAHRRPMIMALEFSRLLRFPVEPPSMTAILSRLLGAQADDRIQVATAVNDLCSSSVVFPRHDGHRLLPILSSIGECKDFDGKATWTDSVARWGVVADAEVSQLELATQTLRELTLTKNLG